MFWRKRLPAIVKKLKRFNAHRLVVHSSLFLGEDRRSLYFAKATLKMTTKPDKTMLLKQFIYQCSQFNFFKLGKGNSVSRIYNGQDLNSLPA